MIKLLKPLRGYSSYKMEHASLKLLLKKNYYEKIKKFDYIIEYSNFFQIQKTIIKIYLPLLIRIDDLWLGLNYI